MLDNRLLEVSKYVSGKGITVDVGTDHAYLASYLIKNDIAKKVIASDLRDGPILSAKKHIKSEGLDESVEVIKSDGLKNVSLDGVTDIVIAGMGGELIAKIISQESLIKEKNINLILQPMSKDKELRKFLYENGYEIKNERAVFSEPFYYSVINAEYVGKASEKSEYELIVGKLDFNRELDREYLLKKAQRLFTAGESMKKSKDKKLDGEHIIEIANSIKDNLRRENNG